MHDITLIQPGDFYRASSYDRTGGNKDWVDIQPGEIHVPLEYEGCGKITHIWMTLGEKESELFALRKLLIRIYWDGEEDPSVSAPLGDFFGLGFGIKRTYENIMQSASEADGKSLNSYFPMPFRKGVRIEIESHCNQPVMFYYNIDYDRLPSLPEETGYFHAQYRHVLETQPHEKDTTHLSLETTNNPNLPSWYPAKWERKNILGESNYTIFEAEGVGHYIGCHLHIDCFQIGSNYWYGEGDEMIWIDQPYTEAPRISGTGTEDYFNMAFCPIKPFSSLYHGLTLYGGDPTGVLWGRKNSMYRLHIMDPIRFNKNIKVSIETGHANILNMDYSSIAYWYQIEPHKVQPPMESVEKRIPRY